MKVNALKQHESSHDSDETPTEVLIAEVKGFRSDLSQVGDKLDKLNAQPPASATDGQQNRAQKPRIEYGCKDCKSKGTQKQCSHCFICGKADHRVETCPDNKKLNSKGSRQGAKS